MFSNLPLCASYFQEEDKPTESKDHDRHKTSIIHKEEKEEKKEEVSDE